jgi:chemotaxis protein CheX
MIDDLDHLVNRAVAEVFSTMLSFPVELQPPGTTIPKGEPHVAGAVGFIGPVSGVLYLYKSVHFARKVTRNLLGLPDSAHASDEMLNDAVGELTNMVVGHIKSRLSDRGMNCVLTIPTIVRGTDFSIEPISTTQRRVCAYDCVGHQLVAEVLLKPIQSPQLQAALKERAEAAFA